MKLFIIETANGHTHIVIAEDMVDAKEKLIKNSTTYSDIYDSISKVRPVSNGCVQVN